MKTRPTFQEEERLWKKGYDFVIGVDEVGRGAFAGPVVVAAVVFEKEALSYFKTNRLKEINDSKLLTPLKRQQLEKVIKKHALFAISKTSVAVINKYGIGKATEIAFRKVLRLAQDKLNGKKLFVLVDGFHIRYVKGVGLKNQKAIIKGDQKSFSIAAASIIAKVYRDNLMKNLHKKFPVYKFEKNKGYGTKLHQEALQKYGLSTMHRTSFNLFKFVNTAEEEN